MLVKLLGKKLYFNEFDFVHLRSTNIPENGNTFSRRNENLWKLEIMKSDAIVNSIDVSVLDYDSKEIENFLKQEVDLGDTIINFVEVKANELRRILISYDINSLEHILEEDGNMEQSLEKDIGLGSNSFSGVIQEDNLMFEEDPYYIYDINFKLDFDKVQIEEGYLGILKQFDFLDGPVFLKIMNQSLKKIYDPIKMYISREIRSKKLTIHGKLKVDKQTRNLLNAEVFSEEVDRIDNSILNRIQERQFSKIFKIKYEGNRSKALLNFDNIKDDLPGLNFGELDFGNIEGAILEQLLNKKEFRNEEQIRYFVEKQNKDSKILITPNPFFGFIFHFSNNFGHYYCWECLNTNATYVWKWKIETSGNEMLTDLEEGISYIMINGRMKYRNSYKLNTEDMNYKFEVIIHDFNSESGSKLNAWVSQLRKVTE